MSDERDKYQEGEPKSPTDVANDVIISSDTRRDHRIPPGQTRTRKWPVLHASLVPDVTVQSWRLKVFGLVELPYEVDWKEFQDLPRTKVFADFHCVTTWSRLGNLWEGVSTGELLKRANVTAEANYVVLHGYDNDWTTNLPLADFSAEDALLADLHDGQPLSADHGGPVRAMIPQLYAWKSAKWIRGIELVAEDRPGYWERAGYHNHGDPWTEERFG